jgi:DNA mismatch endonuclease (patch repair protein)
MPKTRVDFWSSKLEANQARDRRVESDLVEAGWRVLTVWECETRNAEVLTKRLIDDLAKLGIIDPHGTT